MSARRRLAALLACSMLVLGVAACGDDDDDETAAGDETTETTAADGDEAEGDDEAGEEESEGNPCGPDAPDDALPPGEDLDPSATPVTITAVDYEFQGAEPLAAGGAFGITFANEGTEIHEFALSRLADSETRSIEEIIQSGEEPELTEVAFGMACPGEETTFNADLAEPGRYVAVCFIPVGATPEATEEPQGPPHASQGMWVEVEVQ